MPALLRIKPGAVAQYFDGPLWTGKITEVHSSTCAHCQHQTEFPSLKAMMDHVEVCRSCMKLICLGCYGKPCVPKEKRADIVEAETRRAAAGFRCW